jgi:hypothetical protein
MTKTRKKRKVDTGKQRDPSECPVRTSCSYVQRVAGGMVAWGSGMVAWSSGMVAGGMGWWHDGIL